MSLCKLIFAFEFAIKLFLNVVSLSASEIAPLTSIRVDPSVDIGTHPGEFTFGERVLGERFLPPVRFINISSYQRGDGIHQHTANFKSPNGERITRVHLRSWLGSGSDSEGERIHEICYGPNHQSVKILFVSKPYHGIGFTVNLFGR